MEAAEKCRICNSDTVLKWPSNLEGPLSSESFAITDTHYGQTSAIYQCGECGFMQCNDLSDVLAYYERLEDEAYENGRKERYLQAEALIEELKKQGPPSRLLDVGAGSGILVEAAIKAGFNAEGIEPSSWLQQQAGERGLPVRRGLLDDIASEEAYDAITLIDVIEHVEDPMALLKGIRKRLAPGGVALIVTPDCRSFFARLLGRRWWHYRVAHIGYFNQTNLELACRKSDLEVLSMKRPGWFFTMDYLWVRLMLYLPKWLRLKPMNWMTRKTVAINLRDSLSIVVKKQAAQSNGAS